MNLPKVLRVDEIETFPVVRRRMPSWGTAGHPFGLDFLIYPPASASSMMKWMTYYFDTNPPDGELFLPTVVPCPTCEGMGIYKIWGRFDVKCPFCSGTGEE